MIIQQRLDELEWNVRYNEIRHTFTIAIKMDVLEDVTLSSEAIKDIILEIDTEEEQEYK